MLIWAFVVRIWHKISFLMYAFQYCNPFPLSGLIQQTTNWFFFFIFHRKQDLTFHANCLHWKQYVWKVKSYFPEKNKIIFQNVVFFFFFFNRACYALNIKPTYLGHKSVHFSSQTRYDSTNSTNEPLLENRYRRSCASSEDSDQTVLAHPPIDHSLPYVRLKKPWITGTDEPVGCAVWSESTLWAEVRRYLRFLMLGPKSKEKRLKFSLTYSSNNCSKCYRLFELSFTAKSTLLMSSQSVNLHCKKIP